MITLTLVLDAIMNTISVLELFHPL